MYLNHWKLRYFPFDGVSAPEFYYPSSGHRTIEEDLRDALHRRKGAIMLTGEIGCGKSTLSQRLLLALSPDRFDIALITYPSLSPLEMLREISSQLELELSAAATTDKNLLLQTIQKHLADNAVRDRHTIVCIDEAQSIGSLATFEELRMLLNFQLGNRFLMSLLLIGQPELRQTVAQLPQLQQRLALQLHLGALDLNNTVAYLLHRLRMAGCEKPIMTRQAAEAIHRLTGGTPRRINHLFDHCLLHGMRKGTTLVDSMLVSETFQRYPC